MWPVGSQASRPRGSHRTPGPFLMVLTPMLGGDAARSAGHCRIFNRKFVLYNSPHSLITVWMWWLKGGCGGSAGDMAAQW